MLETIIITLYYNLKDDLGSLCTESENEVQQILKNYKKVQLPSNSPKIQLLRIWNDDGERKQ